MCKVALYRYSTSNHNLANGLYKLTRSCIISLFYIKPQLKYETEDGQVCCIISLFYIKPQHINYWNLCTLVALYRYSTSNHNSFPRDLVFQKVALYRYSTSNHNALILVRLASVLHYIVILHQTTTINYEAIKTGGCIISLFYIKPQQDALREVYIAGCIISLFYIKPQQSSNVQGRPCSCIISLFYIKPQRCLLCLFFLNVALYRYSTSNHNLLWLLLITALVALYRYSTSNHNQLANANATKQLHYIVILHQTTTFGYPFH